MDPLTYLTTYATNFGTLEWVFFIAQIVIAVAGIYLAFLRADTTPLRSESLQRLGYALLALGGVGTLAGALRLAGIEGAKMPIWIAIVTILEVILAAYALYYALSVYPTRQAALAEANRNKSIRRGGARPPPALRSNGTNGTPSYSVPRSVANTTRREARRDRKRKGR
jgi:4-amino-4-deoxy-L-arabinose transferase-like glycosyltransferase